MRGGNVLDRLLSWRLNLCTKYEREREIFGAFASAGSGWEKRSGGKRVVREARSEKELARS